MVAAGAGRTASASGSRSGIDGSGPEVGGSPVKKSRERWSGGRCGTVFVPIVSVAVPPLEATSGASGARRSARAGDASAGPGRLLATSPVSARRSPDGQPPVTATAGCLDYR
ncbi:hypothetical protein GCM10011354_31900 [Egicoccus halophilus]|uniref:Uncharacterized protein n=1 Tax=Egicoccus halophilus TaxID=1670830 RepID=A0A8J3AAX6_9ACTN|nr:hypothetical protein GCM10011354_31900 [Egicoccus halophilus]